MGRILIIDDEKSIRTTLDLMLSKEGHNVLTASNFTEALDIIKTEVLDLIFSDIILGDKTGIDILREIKDRNINCMCVLFTGYPNIETASEAVRLDAYDYIVKPIKKIELLRVTGAALRHKVLIDEKNRYRNNLEAIFKSVKDAIISVDTDLRIVEANDSAKELCSISNQKDISKPFNEIQKNEIQKNCDRRCVEILSESLKTSKMAERHRFVCNHLKRREQIVSITIFPMKDNLNVLTGAVMVVKDETPLVRLEQELANHKYYVNIIGNSKKMLEIYSLIDRLKDVDTGILITGESGTGKELIAQAIHAKGSRRDKPFIKVNASAIPENLIESELFGHVKGAFTGAIKDNKGRFHLADTGVIFLDEIGDISPAVQLRLLRVLQEKEFERVGDSKPIKIDVKVIAATNQDLQKKIKAKEFRADLYYRLKVFEILLPPLRDRRQDIPLLINHFINKFNHKFDKNIVGIEDNTLELFMKYIWTGNIRELQHVIEHAFITCNHSVIANKDLPIEFQTPAINNDTKTDDNEYNVIIQALEKTHWNKSNAAKLLGISRRNLYNKINQYNINTNPL